MITIPIFSFKTKYTVITWIFTIAMFLVIGVEFLLFYDIKIDYVVISLSLFVFCGIFSSILNGFKNVVFTPLLLNIVSIILYLYLRSNKSLIKPSLFAIYLALSIFVLAFLILYGKDVLKLNFERLGNEFGDQNDVSLFLSLAFAMSLFFAFHAKPILFKILVLIIAGLAFVCGASTGSKVFILTVATSIITTIALFFGKKRWYLSLATIAVIVIMGIIMFSLPFMATTKKRLLLFISSFVDIGYNQSIGVDASSFDRFHLMKSSFQLFLNKPLFGYGINGFQNANGFYNGWSHNNLGEFLCDFGIIGTILFHSPIIVSLVFYFMNKDNRNNITKRLAVLLIIFFISAMLSVAFTREKIYSYIIPIPILVLFEKEDVVSFSLKKYLLGLINKKKNKDSDLII